MSEPRTGASGDGSERFSAGALAVMGRALQEQLEEQRQLLRILKGVDGSLQQLRERLGELGGHVSRNAEIGTDLGGRVDERMRTVEQALVEALSSREDAHRLLDTVARDLDGFGADLGAVKDGVAQRETDTGDLIEAARQRLADQAERLAEQQERMAAEAGQTLQSLQEHLSAAATAQRDGAAVIEQAAERLDAVGQQAAAVVSQADAHVREGLAERMDEAVRTVKAADNASRAQLIERVEGASAALDDAVTAAREQLARAITDAQRELTDSL
ncbi:MAG: hypothetical protein ACR2KP_02830, partial [Egibacteraceae bacterium]